MTLEDYLKKKNMTDDKEEKKKTTYRESIIYRTLLTVTICLVVLIICNLNTSAKSFLNKYIFETNYSFAKINSLYKKYILDIKKKTIDNLENTKPVNTTNQLEYYNKEDYNDGVMLEVDENYNVKLLESGLVVFIGEKEGIGNTVIVQQSNGIDVTYGNVTVKDIKVYDYIEKGTILGVSNKKLYLFFEKEGEKLDYKTYIK